MKSTFIISVVIALTLLGTSAQGVTRYATTYNHFGSLYDVNKSRIEGDLLCTGNDTDRPMLLIDTLSVAAQTFRYYARLQNAHSKEGHSYSVTRADGSRHKVTSTEAGVVLTMSENDYWSATFNSHNTDRFNDVTDQRVMTVTLRHQINGQTVLKHDTTLTQGMNMTGDFNVIGLDVTPNEITVLAGEKRLTPLLHASLERSNGDCSVGVFVGPGADVGIERAVVAYQDEAPTQVMTQWTRERLDEHFAQSKNPYEGYWNYLDRDLEDKWLKLGGRYTVALVETPTGYDIIYVDGAQVKKSQWLTGMLKGRLKNTIFTDNYQAMWIDATFKPFEQDVYAAFESGVILTINFPVYQSQIRFSKVLE